MIGIPLSLVVALLRPRGALGVLEGAPIHALSFSGRPYLITYQPGDADADVGDVELYLGASVICPAAEGWAARVLAIARGVRLPDLLLLSVSARFICIERDGVLHEWRWDTEGCTARLTSMEGTAPPSPAERLAAVLRYELERAR